MFRSLLFVLAIALGLAAQDTTVVLVRHGEKATADKDTELSALGRQRAQALVEQLLPLKPVALYCSERRRTRQTLEPLGKRLELPVQARPFGAENALRDEILKQHKGQTVVVCGHSDTVPTLAAAMGYSGKLTVADSAFDRLWIVRIPEKGEALLEECGQKPLP